MYRYFSVSFLPGYPSCYQLSAIYRFIVKRFQLFRLITQAQARTGQKYRSSSQLCEKSIYNLHQDPIFFPFSTSTICCPWTTVKICDTRLKRRKSLTGGSLDRRTDRPCSPLPADWTGPFSVTLATQGRSAVACMKCESFPDQVSLVLHHSRRRHYRPADWWRQVQPRARHRKSKETCSRHVGRQP